MSGYELEVSGPVYQAGPDGRMRKIDGAELDPSRPWYSIPDEDAHEQGDEPGELGPEWKELGYITEGSLDLTDGSRLALGPGPVYFAPVGTPPPDAYPRTSRNVSDNEPYVRSVRGRESLRGTSTTHSVESRGVTKGLGREHIDSHREVPPPGKVGLGDAVAALFGAKIVEGRTAEESFVYRPNRAQRRAAAKRRRRRDG